MSRHGGSHTARGWPTFEIIVEGDSRKRDGHFATSWIPKTSKGKMETIHTVPQRTILMRFEDKKAATRYGSRFGRVMACHKVDVSPYFKNIEYLTLEEKPMSIVLDRERFVVNKALELSYPRIEGKNVEVEVVDKD